MINPNDAGVATIPAVAALAALIVVAGIAMSLGGAISTRHRVEAAADLAALAAASYAPHGQEVACTKARWVTDEMAVRLNACQLAGWDALVEVSARAALPLIAPGDAVGHARAGPVDR